MNAHVSIPVDAEPPTPSADVRARQVALLERLAEAGVALAEAIAARGVAGETADTDTAMAFSRVARAVRMTALLQSKLVREMELATVRADCERENAARRAEDEADAARETCKDRAHAIIARVARAQHDDADRIERLADEASERLEQDDIYGDVLARPMSEIVALICRDLGLEPDWERLSGEAWAREEGITPTRPPPLAGEGDHEVVERALCASADSAVQSPQSQGPYGPPALTTIGSPADGPPFPFAAATGRGRALDSIPPPA